MLIQLKASRFCIGESIKKMVLNGNLFRIRNEILLINGITIRGKNFQPSMQDSKMFANLKLEK